VALIALQAQDQPAQKPPEEQPKQTHQDAAADFLAIGAPPDPQKVAAGQKQFVKSCAFCHGTDANGGNSGPNLVRSVLVLHDKGTGKEIGPVVLNGRPQKGMPKFNFSDDQIKDIASFLLSRSQAAANRMQYKILNIVTGDPKAGESYFTAKCASCHSGTGDLAHIAGKFEPVALQSRFLYPKAPDDPTLPAKDTKAEKTVKVTAASGETYEGKLEYIDDFTVTLKDSQGQRHSWVLDGPERVQVEIHDPLARHAQLLREYTNADMHNLLAYLETLK
jgi:mono/diheme cytochrome c family protein